MSVIRFSYYLICYHLYVLSYLFYLFNETKIIKLIKDCELVAKKHGDDVKRFKKVQNYIFLITLTADLLITGIALNRKPYHFLFNYIWTQYFTEPIMSINMKHLLCCYCLNLVDKSIFKPMYIRRRAKNYIQIEETLLQSQDLTQRINRCFGVYPLICLSILIMHVAFMLSHFSHTTLQIDFITRQRE